ncbi:hypothetical protein IH824_18480, partial [candidate division KSB1 bacterium]|nr:hypothetical protein [candidate division KSB1 bacterium]
MTAAGARRLAAIITLSVGLGTAQSPVEITIPSLSFPSAAGMLPLPLTLDNR